MTSDEKWMLYGYRKRSAQWLDHDEAAKHFPKPKMHEQKIIVTVWWSAIDIFHYSFQQYNQSISAKVYCQQMDEMHVQLSKMRSVLINKWSPILIHDNARMCQDDSCQDVTIETHWFGIWDFVTSVIFSWYRTQRLQFCQKYGHILTTKDSLFE